MRKRLMILVLGGMVLCLIALVGVRRDHREPNQHWNQYWAVRELDVWYLFGWELYAENRLAVYDMTNPDTKNLPRPMNVPATQIRRFGNVVEGNRQFNLGENNYERDECLAYIRQALLDNGIDPHAP